MWQGRLASLTANQEIREGLPLLRAGVLGRSTLDRLAAVWAKVRGLDVGVSHTDLSRNCEEKRKQKLKFGRTKHQLKTAR